MKNENSSVSTYHESVAGVLELYDKSPAKSDEILSAQFILLYKNRPFRRVCQFIFLTVLRNKILIDTILFSLCKRKPDHKILAVLRAAAAEIVASETDKAPKIIHSWVEFAKNKCSKAESGFANAVLRKFVARLAEVRADADTSAQKLSVLYSHPQWLVEKWLEEFGQAQTIEILKNNSQASEVFLRKSPCSAADALYSKYAEFLESSKYPNFFALKSGHWDDISALLETPYFYIQDPSTFYAPKLLNPAPALCYLDLCAAPGGKSRTLADIALANSSDRKSDYPADALKNTLIVSVDTSESRMKTLRENLGKIDFLQTCTVDCDILKGDLPAVLKEQHLPELYDGILLDAPCSNTGVLRRRPDARYRITPQDITNCAAIQLKLLNVAATLVKPNGLLVYSTCSIEKQENLDNVNAFLNAKKDFCLLEGKTIFPSKTGDGASAFLLKKNPLTKIAT